MTNAEWIAKVVEHQVKLAALISDYHPAARSRVEFKMMGVPDPLRVGIGLPITAPIPERACRVVREKIAGEYKTDPILDFESAIKDGDVGRIFTILSGAWFGVPESTSCWRIPGFAEAVDLMDDMPDPPDPPDAES